MKKCMFCGTELPLEANFCHNCAKSLLEPQKLKPPKRKRKWPVAVAAIAVMILGTVLFWPKEAPDPAEPSAADSEITVSAQPVFDSAAAEKNPAPTPESGTETEEDSPKVYESERGLLYFADGTEYTIIACFSDPRAPHFGYEYSCELTASDGQKFYNSTKLYALKDGLPAGEEFMEYVASTRLIAEPILNSQPLEFADCWEPESHPGSICCMGFFYTPATYQNRLTWEITMKNGDILRVGQMVSVRSIGETEYHFQDYPMGTLEELELLLEEIYSKLSSDQAVDIYLPPVIYEGGLELNRRTVNLYGSRDEASGMQTTFAGTVIISCDDPAVPEIHGIIFDTAGSGSGLHLACPVVAQSCVFQNCVNGVYVSNNGWLVGSDCSFINNDFGILLNNPAGSSLVNTQYVNLLFDGNGTAFKIANTDTALPFTFPGCIFRGNELAIDNRTDTVIDTSEASFE